MLLSNVRALLSAPASRLIIVAGWAIVALALLAFVARLDMLLTVRSDFTQDYLAAQAALRGESIYDPFAPEELAALGLRPDALQNYHPPFTIALLLPVALLPYRAAVLLWTALGLGLYLWMWRAVLRELGLLSPPGWAPLLVGLSLLWFPLQFHIILAQLSIPLAACVVGSWLALRRGREAMAGALLGLAILIKIFPALLLLNLVARRRWRALGAAVAVGGAGLALTLAVIGPGDLLRYRAEVAPANLAVFRNELHNISLHAAFSRLFAGSEYIEPLVAAPTLANLLAAAAVGGLVLLLAVALWRLPAERGADDRAFAMVCAAMPVLTPTSWSHSFVLLILPLALVLRDLLARPDPVRLRAAALAFVLISLPDNTMARQIASIYQPALVPWYATLPMLLTTAGALLLLALLLPWGRLAPAPAEAA